MSLFSLPLANKNKLSLDPLTHPSVSVRQCAGKFSSADRRNTMSLHNPGGLAEFISRPNNNTAGTTIVLVSL